MSLNISKLIRNQDLFGPLVQLNFRGKSQYNTLRGGVLALLLYALTISQTAILAVQLFSKEDPSVSNYIITDTDSLNSLHYLHEYQQRPVVNIYNPSQPGNFINLDPRAGRLVAYQTTVVNWEFTLP